ncbi:MAG: AAA family ATPase [Alphaproteobacteria bacterium]|nr:AAA family ATPase [Alphaproteobacteria bacterium]MBV8408490.1 AAA family ATPase [Alphaproteobacteria bacterium]
MSLVLREVHATHYRSLRSIRFPTGPLTVFVGPNGAGKTNLYRALQLIQAAAAGTLAHELAAEGGMQSALWAGKRRAREPVRIVLSASFGEVGDGQDLLYTYEVAAGFPPPPPVPPEAFRLEPQIKEETLLFHHRGRRRKLLERHGGAVFAEDTDGRRTEVSRELLASETALGSFEDPARFGDIHALRRTMLDWRFHHSLRTDADSALRQPCLAVTSPTLASDGSNLAAVFATLVHIRNDRAELDQAVETAFPGARLSVPPPDREASFGLVLPEHPGRIFQASELSDGTLRYLALAGALLGLRLPAFLAFNEPESSLHPDLLEPLALLLAKASQRTQIWLVTHSERLAAALAKHAGVTPRAVIKRDGETWLEGLKQIGTFEDEDGFDRPGI